MINEKHKELLQHMLGADSRYLKKQWGYRNRFCAGVGHQDDEHLQEMEKIGLVRSRPFNDGRDRMYFATKAGALAIGFKPYQLRKTDLAPAKEQAEGVE